jgi:poly(A) polymerase Pap1
MNRTGTVFQWRGNAGHAKVWTEVPDPIDIGPDEEAERVALDFDMSTADFFSRFAAYRNAIAAAQGKTLKRKWTRKSLMESTINTERARLEAQLEEMVRAVGPIPNAKDAEAMERYARRVLAWDRKNADK